MDDPTTYDGAMAGLKAMQHELTVQKGLLAELRERMAAHQGELVKKNEQLMMAWHKQDTLLNEIARLKDADQRASLASMRLEEALVRLAQLEAELGKG